jgi:hypothetical protein
MKRIFLSLVMISTVFCLSAQNYETAKNLLALNQTRKAKEEVDKGMTNSKYSSKAEAYILKASTYAMLALDPTVKGTPEAITLTKDAEEAFEKYKQMQPDMALLKDPIYQNAPINLYSSLFTIGYKDYEKKNWQPSFETFKKVVALSDMLIQQKLLTVPVDTNSLILAGVTAESSKNDNEAAIYYARLADLKLADREYESVYRFLVNQSFKKKDMTAFEKYRVLGKQLYPKSEFFDYDKVDFAVGLEEDFNNKLKAVEEVLASDPSNYKAHYLIGGLIYDTLNSHGENAVMPANYAELETRMVTSLKRASELNPSSENPLIYLGGHYINKSKRINDARKKHAADMKTRTKPGTAASKEDIQKRDALDKEYVQALDASIEPYEKAAAIYAGKSSLTQREKQQYKYIAGDLGEIYGFKKTQAKGKPAELAKFTAEEKKWNDLYDTIK